MPKSKVYRKKKAPMRRRFKRRGKFYKSKVGKGEVMVNRVRANLHAPVAPHFLTKLEYGFTGQSTGAAAGALINFSILGNGLHNPANVGANDTFTTGATPGGWGVLYPMVLTLAQLQPLGYSQLGVLYQSYRVYASRISVTCTPVNTLHNIVVYPSNIIGSSLLDYQKAMSQPYSKVIQCTVNNNVRQNTIQIYMDNPTTLGYKRLQYQDDPTCQSVIGTNPTNLTYWNILGAPDKAADAFIANFEIKVVYYIEFLEPLPPTDI